MTWKYDKEREEIMQDGQGGWSWGNWTETLKGREEDDCTLACLLGCSHCCWKLSPAGATQVMLKSCPALTVSSLAFTSTLKSPVPAGSAARAPENKHQHSHLTGPVILTTWLPSCRWAHLSSSGGSTGRHYSLPYTHRVKTGMLGHLPLW